MDGAQSHFGNADSLITIDIGAIVANWLYLDSLSPGTTETAAVVKADAYGLGAAMNRAGTCRRRVPLFLRHVIGGGHLTSHGAEG